MFTLPGPVGAGETTVVRELIKLLSGALSCNPHDAQTARQAIFLFGGAYIEG